MTELTQAEVAAIAGANGQDSAGVIPAHKNKHGEHFWPNPGLTKRELFAITVLQGLLSNEAFEQTTADEKIIARAVKYADGLLQELVK